MGEEPKHTHTHTVITTETRPALLSDSTSLTLPALSAPVSVLSRLVLFCKCDVSSVAAISSLSVIRPRVMPFCDEQRPKNTLKIF